MNRYTASTAADVITKELGLVKEALEVQLLRLVAVYDRPAVSNKREIAILIQDTQEKLEYSGSIASCQYQIERNNRVFNAE